MLDTVTKSADDEDTLRSRVRRTHRNIPMKREAVESVDEPCMNMMQMRAGECTCGRGEEDEVYASLSTRKSRGGGG